MWNADFKIHHFFISVVYIEGVFVGLCVKERWERLAPTSQQNTMRSNLFTFHQYGYISEFSTHEHLAQLLRVHFVRLKQKQFEIYLPSRGTKWARLQPLRMTSLSSKAPNGWKKRSKRACLPKGCVCLACRVVRSLQRRPCKSTKIPKVPLPSQFMKNLANWRGLTGPGCGYLL